MEGISNEHYAKKELFIIEGDDPQLLAWEEYGFEINVPKGTLQSSEAAKIAAVSLVGGHFKFPKNTIVVSGIYALSVSKPLLQPLRLEIQHCVNLVKRSQVEYLKFVLAPITSSLPYEFEIVEGGQFKVGNRYGSLINHLKFCFVGIVALIKDENQCSQPTPLSYSHGEGNQCPNGEKKKESQKEGSHQTQAEGDQQEENQQQTEKHHKENTIQSITSYSKFKPGPMIISSFYM